MDRKPLVQDGSGNIEQLQINDDLDIPLDSTVYDLKRKFRLLLETLYRQNINLPTELKREI